MKGEKTNAVFALTAVQYLETEELVFGEAVTVDYLNLFDQRALATLCSS